MFSLSWPRERGHTRARPSSRRRAARTAALSCMVVAALFQTGCRSGGFFSPCGFVGRTTSRILRPFKHGLDASPCGVVEGGCCGSEISSDVPIEYGAPMGVVGPAVPLGPGPVIEGGSVPSTVSPPSDSPTNLEPLPRAETGPSPSRGGRSSSNSGVRTPSNYDAQRPAAATDQGRKAPHTLVSSPTSTARSSRDAIQASARNVAVDSGDDDNVLDHLPPLDLPSEVTTGGADSPPVAPSAAKPRAAAVAPASASAPASSSTTPATNDQLTGRSAREVDAALVVADAASPEAASKVGDAFGIDRFVAVDLKLAGGGAPSAAGLDWLAEKGYRTILDLRDSSQTGPSFIGEAARRGLRYVAFPVSLDRLERDQLERFEFELSISDARPLYFFDDDGRRAGALWYLRRVLTDKVSPDVARREAQELGLVDAASWKLVQTAVESERAPRADAPAPPPQTPASVKPASLPPAPAAAPRAALHSVAPVPTADANRNLRSIARAALGDDPDAWQPIAAMILTGLTFPLAYFTRTVLPTMLARTRASLPAPARRPKSLPPASGV